MSSLRILIAEPTAFDVRAIDALRPLGEVVVRELEAGGMVRALAEFDIVWFRLGHRVDAATLGEHPRCRILATAVTGLDHIDVEACTAQGVRVVSLKGETEFLRTIRGTAELTVAITLALLRNLPEANRAAEQGDWDRDRFRGRELYGKIAGIVGVGRLGSIVSGYLQAFGMRVLGYDPYATDWPMGVERVNSLDELLAAADVISLHVSYSPKTHHLIGARELAKVRSDAVLINTSRGGVVDGAALLDALRKERLSGAALDVVEGEHGVGPEHPVLAYARDHRNLLVVPHIGGCTFESSARTEQFIAGRILEAGQMEFASGRPGSP